MKINQKILKFFSDKDIGIAEVARNYGTSRQNLTQILNKESGNVPMEFLIWLAENYPELNFNELLQEKNDNYTIRESKAEYGKSSTTKEEILKEVSKILDKYL